MTKLSELKEQNKKTSLAVQSMSKTLENLKQGIALGGVTVNEARKGLGLLAGIEPDANSYRFIMEDDDGRETRTSQRDHVPPKEERRTKMEK